MSRVRSLSRFAVVALGTGAFGCIPVNVPQFPSSVPKASASLQCPAEQVAVRDQTSYSQIATGCGRTDVVVFAADSGWSSLRERAAFELSCPNDQIAVAVLGTSTYGVTGCGKKAVYQFALRTGIVTQSVQAAN